MESHREENSCQHCRMTSPSARNQGLQSKKNGEFKDTNLQPNNTNVISRQRVASAKYWQVHICPTTGGDIELTIPVNTTVEELKTVIARKLKLPIDRINLLYKEKILKSGTLLQHGVVDGCRFTLLPNVETGLSTPKADHHSIMQVLENLSDRQVNEFLAGKAPLTLAMRLGEHMMFVQLQLSSSPFATNKQPASNTSQSSHHQHHHGSHASHHHFPNSIHRYPSSSASTLRRQQHHQRHVNPMIQPATSQQPQQHSHHYHPYHQAGQSSSIQQPSHHYYSHYRPSARSGEEPSMPRKTLHTPGQCMVDLLKDGAPPSVSAVSSSMPSSSSSSSPATMSNAQHNHLKDLLQSTNAEDELPTPNGFRSPPTPTRILTPPFDSPVSLSSGYDSSSSSPMSDCSVPLSPEATTPDASFSASASRLGYEQQQQQQQSPMTRQQCKVKPVRLFPSPEIEGESNTGEKQHSLRETASSNMGTSDVQSNSNDKTTQREFMADSSHQGARGAVIDSMYHMGQGIYSGTFSGTLNPTLQDGSGRPKRSLGTIVHILNDLLSAAPKGKVQVDSLSGGPAATTPAQQAWKHSSPRPSGKRVSGIHPLCGHVGCPERLQPIRRQQPQSQAEDFKRLEKENQVMKDKVEQVQMMLQQRRQRRKARREAKASPYSWQPDCKGFDLAEGSSMKLGPNKNAIGEVKVDSDCNESESDVIEASEHDAAFTSELKPEAVLV